MLTTTFEWVDLPIGPQPLPDWLIGARARWNNGFANAPDVTIVSRIDIRHWEGQSFVREGRALVARHPDGRAHQWGFQGEFEEIEWSPGWSKELGGPAPKILIPATPPSEGCGGAVVECLMAEGPYAGRTVLIRGPWGICPPAGYVDVAYLIREPAMVAGAMSHRESGLLGGIDIVEDLFLRAVARFLPHCRVARISRPGWPDQLELADGAWDVPKTIRLERQARPFTGVRR